MKTLLAFLLLTTSALATPDTLDCKWERVTAAGYQFYITHDPRGTTGFLYPNKVIYKSNAVMQRSRPHGPNDFVFSYLSLGGDGHYGVQIFVNSDMPKIVQSMNLHLHEEPLLRGCKDDPVDRKHTLHG